jgi:integral membrane protein (TIGR01906 family)
VRKTIAILVSVGVALVIPGVLVVNGLRLLANDWYVHAEYARPGFPDDRYGLTKAERTDLALIGLRSIQPQHGEGVELLREARLPEGGPAFTEREIVHMDDVRTLIGYLFWGHLAALGAIAALTVALARFGFRGVLARGLLGGGVLTLAVAALLVGLMLTDFDWLFNAFHRTFFEGETWVFPTSDTLIRVYPEVFWSDFAIVLGVLTVLQAIALTAGAWWWLRRSRRLDLSGPVEHRGHALTAADAHGDDAAPEAQTLERVHQLDR